MNWLTDKTPPRWVVIATALCLGIFYYFITEGAYGAPRDVLMPIQTGAEIDSAFAYRYEHGDLVQTVTFDSTDGSNLTTTYTINDEYWNHWNYVVFFDGEDLPVNARYDRYPDGRVPYDTGSFSLAFQTYWGEQSDYAERNVYIDDSLTASINYSGASGNVNPVTLNDTLPGEVVWKILFSGESDTSVSRWFFTPADMDYGQVDTITDTVGSDTITVTTGGIAEDNASDTFTVFIYDTVGATAVARAAVTLFTSPGNQPIGSALSSVSSGHVTAIVQDGYSYRVVASAVGYSGADTTLDSLTNSDTVYVTRIATDENTTRIFGDVKTLTGDGVRFAQVEIGMPPSIHNSCDSSIIVPRTYETWTNESGRFEVDLVNSACLDSGLYTIRISKDGYETLERSVYVEDQTSQRITFPLTFAN